MFNVLLTANTKYDVCLSLNDDNITSNWMNGGGRFWRGMRKYNAKGQYPVLNAMCFHSVMKAFTKLKQSLGALDAAEGSDHLRPLLDVDCAWKVIDYLLDIMRHLGITKTSVTFGLLFHLWCEPSPCRPHAILMHNGCNVEYIAITKRLSSQREIIKNERDSTKLLHCTS